MDDEAFVDLQIIANFARVKNITNDLELIKEVHFLS